MQLNSQNNPKVVSGPNNIYIVDPNPPGMEMHPPEDMFIYVKFKATNNDRGTLVGTDDKDNPIIKNSGTEGEINFIATQINFNAEGEIDPAPQETYATTNYTNIGGISDANSSGILEGFGIKSIDIKYNASLVPVVDITFTDVRGAGLFDVITNDNRKSPYSIFFKMPYPIFTLSVKGYFGKAVDYCLHMINWTSNFDGSTGNFDISANFVGFQQAFLADMVLGNIIGAVNTQQGYENLMNIFNEEEQKNDQLTRLGSNVGFDAIKGKKDINIRKLDDFFLRISKLQIEAELIKDDSEQFKGLRIMNSQLAKLENIRTFIGSPLKKVEEYRNEKNKKADDYIDTTNDPTQVRTKIITDNILKIGINYLSIRDYIIVSSIQISALNQYFSTLSNLIEEYQKFIVDSNREEKQRKEKVIDLSEEMGLTTTIFKFDANTNSIIYQNYLEPNLSNTNEDNSLNDVFDALQKKGGMLNKYFTSTLGVDSINPNSSFDPTIFVSPTNNSKVNRTNYNDQMLLGSNVKVLDFTAIRSTIESKIRVLTEKIEVKRKKVQKELNEKLSKKEHLGFIPTIKDVFRIICNNTQAMISTIYDISRAAESKSISGGRTALLDTYITDIPTDNKNTYAWPKIYERSDIKGTQEIYIGDVNGVNTTIFPEYGFVEKVFKILVAKRKELKQISRATKLREGLDNDKWFPINPIDYSVPPFLTMNILNNEIEINKSLAKQLFLRSAVLYTYSQPNKTTGGKLSDYAKLDGINANKAIFSSFVRQVLDTKLDIYSADINKLVKVGEDNDIIEKKTINNTEYYKLIQTDTTPTLSDITIGDVSNPNVDYIVLDNNKIIGNAQSLWPEIISSDAYDRITDDKEKGGSYHKSFYFNKNYTYNIFNNVWKEDVNAKLTLQNPTFDTSSSNTFPIKNMITIDTSGNTSDYINKLNAVTQTNDLVSGEMYLTESMLYEAQVKDESKALLLLSTFPFETFQKGVLNTFISNDYSARIVNLPTYYLYFIGGLLWRESSGTDPIEWPTIYTPSLSSDIDYYLTNLGANKSTDKIKLEDSLTKLPQKTKNILINLFEEWAGDSNTFNDFEEEIITYKDSTISIPAQALTAANNIVNKLRQITNMILPAPIIFYPNLLLADNNLKNGVVIPVDIFKNDYFNSFQQKFKETNKNNKTGAPIDADADPDKTNKTETKIKLGIYNYFKNINDKWVGSTEKTFNACVEDKTKNLIEYFKFIDRGWSDIGDKAVINLNSLLTLASNLNTSVYFYISKILRDSNFLFQILPNYINYKDPEEVEAMFKPIANINEKNKDTGPAYVCIYVGGNSEVLDIAEENKYYFSNDGFDFNSILSTEDSQTGTIPPDITNEKVDKFSLVAFRVAFGSENQTIFKGVSLSQQEHRETGEYFRALSDLIDKRGGTQRVYQGTDLLRLFKTRSYSCKVEALGCMNIQPLMYFDLQNVPFFNGAYLITSVNHNITANHMTTSFTGLRQSKYITSYVDDFTAFLDIDLKEGSDDTLIPFDNLQFTDDIYKIGVKDPTAIFNMAQLTLGVLKDVGVSDKSITTPALLQFKAIMSSYGIRTNAQVTMFLGNVLSNSNNLAQRERQWNPGNKDSYIVYKTVPVVNTTNNPGVTEGQYEKILGKKIPLTYPNLTNDIVYSPPGDALTNPLCVRPLVPPIVPPDATPPVSATAAAVGNTEPGDGWRYRHRGYLYLVGKTQYEDNLTDPTVSSYLPNPETIGSSTEAAFQVAALVWTQIEGADNNTCHSLTDESNGDDSGSNSTYMATVAIAQQYRLNDSAELSFKTLKKLLNRLGLLTLDNP